jgi:hypothetical protein
MNTMRKLFFPCLLLTVSCLLFFGVSAPGGIGGKVIVFMPFYDESGYRGPWELSYEIPQMIGDMISGAEEYFTVVPMDTVKTILDKPEKKSAVSNFFSLFSNKKSRQKVMTDAEVLSIARHIGADFAITGVIEDFNFKRTGAGDPMVGGYKSYNSKVSVDQVRILRVADGRPLGTVKGEENKTSRGLGLELLGKPRQMDLEFYSLDSLDFGSKRYLSTLLGQTTVEALNKVHKEIRAIITKPDTTWFVAKKFKVLSIERGEVIINAGFADGISPGDRFNVFAAESGVRVGKINVINVWSDHAAKAEVLEGKEDIRPEDFIMPEL